MLRKTLDKAAEEYAYNNWEDNDYHTGASEGLPFDAIGHTANCFKAGAQWMAGQGVIKEAVIGMATKDIDLNVSQRTLDALGLGPGDKVIVQIRKKMKPYVKIDRKVLFEICDAILEADGSFLYSEDEFPYYMRWGKKFYKKVQNIRHNS